MTAIEDRVAALEGTLGTLIANLLEPALIGPYLTFGDGGKVQIANYGIQIRAGTQETVLSAVSELPSDPDTLDVVPILAMDNDGDGAGVRGEAEATTSSASFGAIAQKTSPLSQAFISAATDTLGVDFRVVASDATTAAYAKLSEAPLWLEDLNGDPSTTLKNGMIWHRDDTDKFRGRLNGATVNLATEGYVDALAGPSWGSGTELTIATGAITVTDRWHQVDTEGDAGSDDLATISGGTTGQPLVLTAINDARTVVVKHGTGNIYLDGGADFSLDHSRDSLTLLYNGSAWIEISKADNA